MTHLQVMRAALELARAERDMEHAKPGSTSHPLEWHLRNCQLAWQLYDVEVAMRLRLVAVNVGAGQ